ncbi:MAG: tetratricopeptide repeat protein [Paludibacteraceae bacterium]|nr:tetratricopeptide repeat protein [Paludibacteraceae bacterium]
MANKKQDKFEKQDEQLQEVNNALTGAGQWIEKHSKALTIGVTVIVLVILGIFAYKQFVIEPRHRAATKENGENFIALASGETEDAANGFAATADKYDNQEGKFAALNAGEIYAQMGEYEEAIKYLEKFSSDDMHFQAAAKQLLGDCYAELEDYEAAINAYWAAANTGNEVFAPTSLKKAGIAYLKLEDKEGAHDAFTTLKERYPASLEAQDIDKYIALTE